MPYLLPDGDAFEDELECILVFYPNRPEYRRALLGQLTDLTKWWMWERDELKRGADAADSWDLAIDVLMECIEMGFCDEMLAKLDTVINLLQNADYCCEFAPFDETVESDFEASVPGTDTPPGTWGDGETVADTDDWRELVCGAAHAYVDLLINMANEIDSILDAGAAITVGIIAGILAILSGGGATIALAFSTAAGAVSALLDLTDTTVFSDAAAELEAGRSDIVCAVVEGGLGAAVQGAINGTAWATFFTFVDYVSARNVMLEGGHGGQHLEVNRRTDCDCAADELLDEDLGTEDEGWGSENIGTGGSLQADYVQLGNNQGIHFSIGVEGYDTLHIRLRGRTTGGVSGNVRASVKTAPVNADLVNADGALTSAAVQEIEFDLPLNGNNGPEVDTFTLRNPQGTTFVQIYDFTVTAT